MKSGTAQELLQGYILKFYCALKNSNITVTICKWSMFFMKTFIKYEHLAFAIGETPKRRPITLSLSFDTVTELPQKNKVLDNEVWLYVSKP